MFTSYYKLASLNSGKITPFSAVMDSKGRVVIPACIRRRFGLRAYDAVVLVLLDGGGSNG